MKKVLTLVLALVLCLSLLPAGVLAANGGFVIENGVLTKYNGSGGAVTIPGGVTKIGSAAFIERTDLTSVTIPDGVTEIEWSAFFGCAGMTGVNMPDSLRIIGPGAFGGCTGLTSVTIPSGVTELGRSAFVGCAGLTGITIPGTVTKIMDYAFDRCAGLTKVVIPESVTQIGSYAFCGCTRLTSVAIPSSVAEIGEGAFDSNVSNVYYGGSEAQWKALVPNTGLSEARVHYNSVMPGTPVYDSIAYATTQGITVDGKKITFSLYALRDSNGNDSNYIRLRDVAHVFKGTAAQFSVGWNGPTSTITATSGGIYQDVGSEMSTPFSGNRAYQISASKLIVNGKTVDVDAILLQDDKGGGYTYYKLRDLGKELNFNVSWFPGTGIVINTNETYSDAN